MIFNLILAPLRLLFMGALSFFPDADPQYVAIFDNIYTTLYHYFTGLDAFIPLDGFLSLFSFFIKVEVSFFLFSIIRKIVKFFSFGVLHV